MSSKQVLKFKHPRDPGEWIFHQPKRNTSKVISRIESVPSHVTLSPKDGPSDPHHLADYSGENATIFCVCPCSPEAFKSLSAGTHWRSQIHNKYIDVYKRCTVKHAFFFNKPEDRDYFLQGGTPEFLRQPDRHGKMRDSSDESDEEYVPKAKRPGSSPLPPFPTIASNPHQSSQTYQPLHDLHSLHSSASSDSDEPSEENTPIPLPFDLQDQYPSKTYDDYDDYGDFHHRDNSDDSPQLDADGFSSSPLSSASSSYDRLINSALNEINDDYDAETETEDDEEVNATNDDRPFNPEEYGDDDSDGIWEDDDVVQDDESSATDTPEMSTSDENQSLPSSAPTSNSVIEEDIMEAAHQLGHLMHEEDDREPEQDPPQINSISEDDAVWLDLYQALYDLIPVYLPQTAVSVLLTKIRAAKTKCCPQSKIDASSYYHLRRLCSKGEPTLKDYEDPKTKTKVTYRDLKDAILQISGTLKRSDWFLNSSSPDIPVGHPMRAGRWKLLEELFPGKNLLGLYLFIDGFQPLRYSKVTNFESLSIGLVNTKYENGSRMISKCSLMVLPKGCDPHVAVSKCFIEPLEALRTADVRFPKLSGNPLFPVLFSVLGDDVGQRKISGIGGPINPEAINRWLTKVESNHQLDLLRSLQHGLARVVEEDREGDSEVYTPNVGSSMDLDDEHVGTVRFVSMVPARPTPFHNPLFPLRNEATSRLTMAAYDGTQQAPKRRRNSRAATPTSSASAASSMAPSVAASPNISAPYTPQERDDIANGKKKGFQISPVPVLPSTRTLRSNESIISAFEKLQTMIARRDENRENKDALQKEFKTNVVPLLRQNGLLLHGSKLADAIVPVWHHLPEVKIDYIGSFSPCLLHNIDFGIIPITIILIGSKLGSNYRLFMNDFLQCEFKEVNYSIGPQYQVQLFRSSTTLTSQKATWYRSFFMKYFWDISGRYFQQNQDDPKVGKHWETFTQMVKDVQFIVNSLYSKDKNIDMSSLDTTILNFRTSFHKYKSTYVPNLETLDAYLHLIGHQGFPIYTSTQRWEPIHQGLRKTIRNSNKADICRDMISRTHRVSGPQNAINDDRIVEEVHENGFQCVHSRFIKRPKTSTLWQQLINEPDIQVLFPLSNPVDVCSGQFITKILGFPSLLKIYCFDSEKLKDFNRPDTLFKATVSGDVEKAYCLRGSFSFRRHKPMRTAYHYVFISSLVKSSDAQGITYTVEDEKRLVCLEKLKITSILRGALVWDEKTTDNRAQGTKRTVFREWKEEELVQR